MMDYNYYRHKIEEIEKALELHARKANRKMEYQEQERKLEETRKRVISVRGRGIFPQYSLFIVLGHVVGLQFLVAFFMTIDTPAEWSVYCIVGWFYTFILGGLTLFFFVGGVFVSKRWRRLCAMNNESSQIVVNTEIRYLNEKGVIWTILCAHGMIFV